MAAPTVSDFDVIDHSGQNTTSHTFNKPANLANGDYWIIQIACDGQGTMTWPSGFTEIAQTGISGTGGATGGAAYKEISDAGSEPATVTVTSSGSEKATRISFRLVGAAATDPVDAVGVVGATNASSYTVPGLTTTVNDCLLVVMVASDGGQDFTEDTGWTQVAEQNATDNGSASANTATKAKATAGAEADANWSQSTSQEAVRFMVAFAPAAAGGSTFTGSLAETEAADTLSASGTFTPPPITGSLAETEAADTLAASGTHVAPSFTGSLAETETADTLAASGTFTAPVFSGSLAETEEADSLAASGTFVPATLTGSLAETETDDTLAAAGTFTASAQPGSTFNPVVVTVALSRTSVSVGFAKTTVTVDAHDNEVEGSF